MKKHLKLNSNFLLIFLFIVLGGFTVPNLQGPVMDLAQVIDPQDAINLETLIRQVNNTGLAQIQVLTVPNLQGDVIENASIQITDKWQLGDKKKDNGILLLFAQEERKVRIEVGQGLEGDLPDAYANRIIHDVMIPYFKRGEFSKGIVAGVVQIISKVAPDYLSQPVENLEQAPAGKIFYTFAIIMALFFIFIIPKLPGRRFYGRRGYSSGWYGGGWGSGGSGWGGGGGFSGGGSSGSW